MGNAVPKAGVLGRAGIILFAMVVVLLFVFLEITVLEAHLALVAQLGVMWRRWRCVCACVCALNHMPHRVRGSRPASVPRNVDT